MTRPVLSTLVVATMVVLASCLYGLFLLSTSVKGRAYIYIWPLALIAGAIVGQAIAASFPMIAFSNGHTNRYRWALGLILLGVLAVVIGYRIH